LNFGVPGQYQAYLLQEKRIAPHSAKVQLAVLSFFYVRTLKRREMYESLPYPKTPRTLPVVLSEEEVAHLMDSASNLLQRTILMALYSTGARRGELAQIQVTDVDSQRMVVHIRAGKGGHDRDVSLRQKLLEALRQYWRWMKPKTWLFPGLDKGGRVDHRPISDKVVWWAVQQAAKRAGIQKRITPHTLRHYAGSRTIPGEASPEGRGGRQCWGGARPLLELPGIVCHSLGGTQAAYHRAG
jgi:integrase